MSARRQPLTSAHVTLLHAHARLVARVEELLAADLIVWTELYAAVQALAAIAPRVSEGEMLTTAEMARRLGLSVKTLLKHTSKKRIAPAVHAGKLIRWRGDEVPR
jgi:excisionase family DNA binding protein